MQRPSDVNRCSTRYSDTNLQTSGRSRNGVANRIARRRASDNQTPDSDCCRRAEEERGHAFVPERRRSRRLYGAMRKRSEHQLHTCPEHAVEERAGTLFVGDRRQSRRLPSTIRRERSERNQTGLAGAWLRLHREDWAGRIQQRRWALLPDSSLPTGDRRRSPITMKSALVVSAVLSSSSADRARRPGSRIW